MSWFLIYTLWQKKISFNVARGKLFLFLIFQTVLFREGYNPACDQTAVNRHAMIGQMVLGYVFRLSDLNKLSARLSIASMARSLARSRLSARTLITRRTHITASVITTRSTAARRCRR